MSYFKDNIDAMTAYVPGEQPKAGDGAVKMNTNENAYPPSPKVTEALREFNCDALQRYPDPMAREFSAVAAEVLGVPVEWILPGNGSDDIIVMISRACAGPGRRIVYPTPTFEFYFTQGAIEAAEVVEIPTDENFALPVDDIIQANGDVTFIANPNSPTGVTASIDDLRQLAGELDGLLVIDEAYADFAEVTAIALVSEFDNVIVLRTLSKGYSLAGLRLGFGVARSELLDGLMKTKAIYNVDAVSATLGAAAMRDQDYKNDCASRIIASRNKLAGDLEAIGFTVWDSQANFLMVRPPAGAEASDVCNNLKERMILVRYFDSKRLDDKLRITIGDEEQNKSLLNALKEILPQ